jgi:hypothetical protein
MRWRGVAVAAVALMLAGCGQSSAEKNAAALKADEHALRELHESTYAAARAHLEVERAEPQTKARRALERKVERAIRTSEAQTP